jgi:hypothetical protein
MDYNSMKKIEIAGRFGKGKMQNEKNLRRKTGVADMRKYDGRR